MRNLSLQELINQVEELDNTKKDLLVDSTSLTMGTEGENCYLVAPSGRNKQFFRLSDTARQQLTSRLDIPWNFAERLRLEQPALLDRTVNTLLRNKPEQRLIRTLSGDTCRAYLSPSYKILDNGDFLRTVLPLFTQQPDLTLQESYLTDSHLQMTILQGEQKNVDVRPGDAVRYGVVLLNSEVGLGSLSVASFVHRLVCTNGLIIPESQGYVRRIHLGRRSDDVNDNVGDRSLWYEYSNKIKELTKGDNFPLLISRIREAAAMPLIKDTEEIVDDLGKRFALSKEERAKVQMQYDSNLDRSLWGIVNAVTEVAKTAGSIQRRYELQSIGGKLLPQINIPYAQAAA